jgi:DNA-binding transcriptional MerR regulator
MRISELSDRTGVTVATLKYYLRESLLHPGTPVSATRSEYDESHLDRVRLVRALIDVGHLSIDRVREVVQALDHPPASRHELLGSVHLVLRTENETGRPVDERVTRLAWRIEPRSVAAAQVSSALERAARESFDLSDETFATYASAALAIAERDVSDELGDLGAADALRYAVLGTVLTDPILVGLRRLAQEHVSAVKFGGLAEAAD